MYPVAWQPESGPTPGTSLYPQIDMQPTASALGGQVTSQQAAYCYQPQVVQPMSSYEAQAQQQWWQHTQNQAAASGSATLQQQLVQQPQVAWQQQPASWQQHQLQAWQQHQACRPGSYPSGQFGITPAASMPQNNGQMLSSVPSAGSWQPAQHLVQQPHQQQQQAQRPASQQAKPLPLHQQEAAIPGGTGSGTGFYPLIHAGSGEAGGTAAALAVATPPLTPAVFGPAATAAGNCVLYPNLQQSSASTPPSLCGAPSSSAGYPSTQQLGAVCSAAAECSPIPQPPGVAADSIAMSTPTPQQPQAAAPWSLAVPPFAGDAAAKEPTGAAHEQQPEQPEQQESKVEAGGGTEAASSDGRWQEGSWGEAAAGGEGSFEEAALLALLLGDAPSCPAAPATNSGLSWQSANPFTAEASPFTASSASPLDHAPSAPLATKSFIARHRDSGSCGGGGDGTSSGGAWQAWASTSCDEAAAAAAAYSTGAGDAQLQQEVAAGQEAGSDSAALGLSTGTGTGGDGTASTGNGTGTGTGIDDGDGSLAADGDKGDATVAAAAVQVDSSVDGRPELPDASTGESLQLASHQLQLLSLTASTTVSSRSETVAGGRGGSVPDSGSSSSAKTCAVPADSDPQTTSRQRQQTAASTAAPRPAEQEQEPPLQRMPPQVPSAACPWDASQPASDPGDSSAAAGEVGPTPFGGPGSAADSGGSSAGGSTAVSGSSSGKGRLHSGSRSMTDISFWQVQFDDVKLQRPIGEGSFGKVYEAKWNETLVAVKVFSQIDEVQQAAGPDAAWTLSNPILCNLQKECGLMASLRHPNVVQFMGVSAKPPALISEYCSKGSLADVLSAARKSPQKAALLTWPRRLNLALDATKGMLYLHKRGIVHRDLKSPNLLVDSTWRVKVADFNLSKIMDDGSGGYTSSLANMNPRWLSPEIVTGSPATPSSDVYAWGVVMWELLTLKQPWKNLNDWAVAGQLRSGGRLDIPACDEAPGPPLPTYDAYVALMQRCWAEDPGQRPCFAEVIVELRAMMETVVKGAAAAQPPHGAREVGKQA